MSERWAVAPADYYRGETKVHIAPCGVWNTVRILAWSTLIGAALGVLIWRVVR